MPLLTEGQYLRLRLNGEEDAYPTLLDVSGFLQNFNLLYEFMRFSVEPEHQEFRYPKYAFRRDGLPLKISERLRIESLGLGSPFVLSAVVPVVGQMVQAVAGVVGLMLLVHNASLNRDLLKLQVNKLKEENRGELAASVSQAFDGTPVRKLAGSNGSEQFEKREDERGLAASVSEAFDGAPVRSWAGSKESEQFEKRIIRLIENSPVRIKIIDIEFPDSGTLNREAELRQSGDRELTNANMGRSSDPELEEQILNKVGSYGKQLGIQGDAMMVLLNHVNLDDLLPRLNTMERQAIDEFLLQRNMIDRLKSKRRSVDRTLE